MHRNTTRVLNWSMIALGFGVAAWLSPRIPELVPTHWDARGHVNGYMQKPLGVYVLPLTMLGVHALLSLVPRISPRESRAAFGRGYEMIHTASLAFLLFVTVLALRAAAGEHMPMLRATSVALGLLLIVSGNFLGKVQRNFFVGIRTPWTLANDEVWLRTHRLAGKTFVLGGLLVVASVLLGAGVGQCTAIVLLAALVPAGYSYFVYRRLQQRP
ncbi:MAG TPA: SdpI family protein [Polyangiaceae bacterium]|nr:SdpI family protein [Polyangiaceae bacterium]